MFQEEAENDERDNNNNEYSILDDDGLLSERYVKENESPEFGLQNDLLEENVSLLTI